MTVHIIAHRGHWIDVSEKNSVAAFRRALDGGFGIETDLRDLNGRIVISHDIPGRDAMVFDDFLALYREYPSQPMLALNVKSDGLQALAREALVRHDIRNYFFFDMSVPDTLGYFDQGLTVFTRRSEFETGSILDDRAQGLWLDSFETAYVDPVLISQLLAQGRQLALVSPELHRKSHLEAWTAWRALLKNQPDKANKLFLCTDLPEKAQAFFSEVSL